jgi:fatty acid/phospholipid synthesis protein PlsX
MKIVIDAMGGDNAPKAVVEGSVAAVNEYGVNLILVGDNEAISNELSKYSYDKSKIEIIHTTEVISNNEHPAMAIRKKKDSSMVVGLRLVKEGKGHAFISAGSTGALLTGATLIIGRIKGIDRPAIAPVMPGKNGAFMVIDAGANVDTKPKNLVQFGIMGTVYFRQVIKKDNPSVGLVNIGTEEAKGNELTKAAYQELKSARINFAGNIEPRDIPEGNVDIVVCDGFVGNTILKMYEGASSMVMGSLKEELMSGIVSKIGALILKPSFKRLKKKFDYTEYGGAAFLGVNGGVVKAHGSSNAKAIKNAIRQAVAFVENNVLEQIKDNIIEMDQEDISEKNEQDTQE